MKNSNLPAGTENDSNAPWNSKDQFCPNCGSTNIEPFGQDQDKCTDCGYKLNI